MKSVREFKAKPKTATVLMYDHEAFITLNSNQVWNVKEFEDGTFTARWKCIAINFKPARFNMMFKRVTD